MAKKEKIQLSPEEAAAKKIRRSNGWVRFWAVVVALVLTVSLVGVAKMGGADAEVASGTNTQTNNSSSGNSNNSSNSGSSSSNNDSTSSGDSNTSNGDNSASNSGGNAGAATNDTAAIIKKLNEATAKAVSAKAGYKYDKDTQYVSGQEIKVSMFGGDATSVLNGIIKGVSSGSDLNGVVGNFIGIGGRKAAVPKGQVGGGILEGTDGWTMYDYEALATAKITESNVSSASMNGNKISLTLKDSTTPQSGDGSALANLTENFLTLDRVNKAISDGLNGTSSVTVQDSSTVQYSNIKVECELNDSGNIVNYKIYYTFSAALDIKVLMTIKGTGAADTVITYSDFQY